MRRIILGLIAALFFATPAMAVNCSTYPYTLTNGTPADANQVMANFNLIRDCANSSLAHSGANSDITSLTGLTTPFATLGANTFTNLQIIAATQVPVGDHGDLTINSNPNNGNVATISLQGTVGDIVLISSASAAVTIGTPNGVGICFLTANSCNATLDTAGNLSIAGALNPTDAATTRTNLGLGSFALLNVTYSNSTPTGSATNGAQWVQW